MSRIGEGGFGFAEQARAAAEQAQLEARRQAEVARAEALAEEARAAIEAARQSQPEDMGRVLGEVMLMLPEARQAFAQRLAEEQGSRARVAATVAEAPQIVKRMVDEACPPGTEMRGRLGVALLERVGVAAKGLTVQALEGAVTRALGSLGPRGAGPAVALERGDRLERAEPRRFGGNALEVRTPGLPAGEATSAGGGPVPSVAPPAERLARPVVGRESGPGAPAPDAFMRGERPSVVVERPVSPAPQDVRRPVTRDVAADLEALSAALDPSRSLATLVSSATAIVAGARLGTVERPVGARLFGIAKMSWEGGAEALLGKKLASIQGSLQTLQGRADAVRQVLVEADTRRAVVQVGLQGAAEHLEGVSYRLGVAAELSRLQDDARQSLRGVVASRAALSGVGAEAEGAIQSLSGLNVHGLPRAIGEIREVVRQARIKEAELRTSYGQGTLLEQIDAGAGVLAEPASAFPDVSAGETEVTAAEVEGPEVEGPGVLTEEDLKRIGSGLDPQKASPQTVWTEGMVNTVCDLGRQQGGVTEADGARHMELARMVLGQEGADLAGPGHELAAADLAVALKMAGVPLEKVDPNQLAAAARYVSSATSLSDQQDKLRKTLDSFQVLSSVGLPRLSRQQMVEELWTMAKVPGHALQKLSDSEIQKKFQEVAAALNGGPGPTQIKVGQHNLKLEVGENGQVLGSSCKKPGFFSKVWSGIKKVAPIVLTVASFIPVTAPFARAAQGVISIVQAIKSKSLLGVATAGAALLGAGAAIARGASQVVGTVERVANAAARSLQGVSSLRSGNVLGGLASIGSGLASGVGSFAGDVTKGLGKVADRLGQYSTKLSAVAAGTQAARSYEKAGKAVDEARRNLAEAQVSGDSRAVAAAQAQLEEAESQKRTSLFGAAAGAFEAASLWVGSKPNFPDQAKNPSVGVGLESRLQLASRALNVARDVSGQDYLSAAVSGLGVAANLDARSHSQGSILGDASRVAEANLGYYRSQSGLDAARSAVEDAEARVRIARASGDAAALEQAESALGQARRGLETATMGSIASGQSLVETAAAVRSDREQRAALAETLNQKRPEADEVTKLRQLTSQSGEQLLWVLQDPRATPAQKQEAMAALLRLAEVGTAYEDAVSGGDPSAILTARGELENLDAALRAGPPGSVQVASLDEQDVEPQSAASGSGSKGPAGAPATGAYRVAEGDSLWRLAKNYGITVDQLLAVNPDLGPEGRIRTGEVIRIPMPERSATGTRSDAVVTIEIPPPMGIGTPSAGGPSGGSSSAEGWGSFWEGVVEGDFSDNTSWSKMAGQVLLGLVPYAGQAADARDTAAALDQVREGRPGAWTSLLAAGVAWIPGAGDALKGAIRGGKKVATEAAEGALEQGVRHAGTDAAQEATETAARGTSPAGVPGTIAPKSVEDVKAPIPERAGPYGVVGGHHVHGKAAFRGHATYDLQKGFSISQDFMRSQGWRHDRMTATQRRLFRELKESGRPNTLTEHTRIAIESLKAGGATAAQARALVAQSLRDLRVQGVKQPTRIPWFDKD